MIIQGGFYMRHQYITHRVLFYEHMPLLTGTMQCSRHWAYPPRQDGKLWNVLQRVPQAQHLRFYFEGVVVLKRTDFEQFLLWDGLVVLKEHMGDAQGSIGDIQGGV